MRSHTSTFNVIKSDSKPPLQQQGQNMFQPVPLKFIEEFNPDVQKPVGGLSIFLKERKKRENSSKNINSVQNRKVLVKSIKRNSLVQEKQQSIKVKTQYNTEQAYRTHSAFRPQTALTKKFQLKHKELQSRAISSKTKMSKRTANWVDSQIQNFNEKCAILSEVNFKQPLHIRYGDRYFEYMLRQRYKDQLPAPQYIYQLKEKRILNNRNTNHNKFLKTFEKFRPDIVKRQKIVLHGKQIKNNNFCTEVNDQFQ